MSNSLMGISSSRFLLVHMTLRKTFFFSFLTGKKNHIEKSHYASHLKVGVYKKISIKKKQPKLNNEKKLNNLKVNEDSLKKKDLNP